MTILTTDEIRSIVEKAAFFHERIGPDYLPRVSSERDETAVDDLLQQWCVQIAPGDEENFAKRLEWDGLSREGAKAIIRGVQLREGVPLPPWAVCLSEVLDEARQMAGLTIAELTDSIHSLSAADPVPFEHVLAPFLRYAARQVQSASPGGHALVSDRAHSALVRALLQTLSTTAGAALQLEFSTALALGAECNWSEDGYSGFVRHMHAGGLGEVIQEYPVMGRQLAQSTVLWCAFIGDLLHRIEADLPALQQAFGGGKPLGSVSDAGPRMSDPHNGGTTVVRISFESGATCYYKPKNIDSEHCYYDLLNWINDTGGLLPFRTVHTICRDRYGWVESIAEIPMANSAEAARYYERAGMLLCILYVLGANDCIVENIIPHGEHPVLIDAETFFQPLPNLAHRAMWGAASVANRGMYHNSVLRVGMLPRWTPGRDGSKNDIHALGGSEGVRGHFQKRIWEFTNTDRMRYAWKTIPVMNSPSLLHGKPILPGDYVSEIIDGFSKMYKMFESHPDELIDPAGPIGKLRYLSLRFLARSTYIYEGIIHRIQLPQHQTDGMKTSVQVDALSRQYVLAERLPAAWPLIATEHASILQLDIPRFTVTPCSAALGLAGNGAIEDFFVEPRFDSVCRQVSEMSSSDMELQIAYIRCSFAPPYQSYVHGNRTNESVDEKNMLGWDEAVGEAVEIAKMIERSVIRGTDGTVTWITHGYNPDSQFWQIQPMGFRLYDGVLGTGLFLAAMHNAVNTNGYRDLALASLKIFSDTSSKPVRFVLLHDGLGAGLGVGSIIYSLLLAGQLLEEPALLVQAERVAALITPELIATDRRLDVLGGAAGCLLVLLRLYEATRKDWILDLAVQCGAHLLKARSRTSTGDLSWQTIQGKYLAGFSHGVAGIGYALARLSQATGEERYRDAATAAYEYENSLFDEAAQNWANLLSPKSGGGYEFWTSWCHGAPGVGLGRIGGLADAGDGAHRKDLECAIESAATAPLNNIDTLCCGTLGRLEVLLEAERVLGRDDCGNRARRIAKQVVRKAKERGSYNFGLDVGIYVPSFHQGMAGIGYQLLRVTDPVRFPSVLSWQTRLS